MTTNLLRNGGFEADWSEERSHLCRIYPTRGEPYEMERGEVFNPPGWVTFCRHGRPVEHDPGNPVGWAMPEVRQAPESIDAARVRSGENGELLFTFYRVHDCGLLQQVRVEQDTHLRLGAWAHAWSSQGDDPRQSEGVGHEAFFAEEGTPELNSDQINFTFWVGIDPTGGTDPYAGTVVWGKGAHIYNAFHEIPHVEAVAEASTVTVFLRSRCLWPFKHNDAYFDDAVLEAVVPPSQTEITFEPAEPKAEETIEVTVQSTQAYEDVGLEVTSPDGDAVPVTEAPVTQPPEGKAWRWTFVPGTAGDYHVAFTASGGAERPAEATLAVQPKPVEVWGLPRVQYARTYVLLPPEAGRDWVQAILESGAWDRHRWTIGGSADDAGIGALHDKTVIAINPGGWPSDLRAFLQQYYPRTRYVPLEAADPSELRRKLQEL